MWCWQVGTLLYLIAMCFERFNSTCDAVHMSPLWGFKVGWFGFPIHISPRWGYGSGKMPDLRELVYFDRPCLLLLPILSYYSFLYILGLNADPSPLTNIITDCVERRNYEQCQEGRYRQTPNDGACHRHPHRRPPTDP